MGRKKDPKIILCELIMEYGWYHVLRDLTQLADFATVPKPSTRDVGQAISLAESLSLRTNVDRLRHIGGR